MKTIQYLVMLTCLSLTHPALASDLAKEKRWADQIVEFLVDGEAEWLDVDGQQVLSIYTESATDTTRGGVIVAHGSGAHPNWEDVVHPLRTQLPEHGWATLSIQLPILHNEAEYHEYAPLFDEVAPRMDAAIKHLQAKGITKIMIVAHSLGSAMSAYYLSTASNNNIKGFVAVGMPGPREDKRMNTLLTLKKVNVPILDIYGSKDLEGILASAGDRSKAAAHNKNYMQKVIDDANHFFVNKNSELVDSVNDWLGKY